MLDLCSAFQSEHLQEVRNCMPLHLCEGTNSCELLFFLFSRFTVTKVSNGGPATNRRLNWSQSQSLLLTCYNPILTSHCLKQASKFITLLLMKRAAKSQRAAKKESCELSLGNIVHIGEIQPGKHCIYGSFLFYI